jgi:anti-sigma factor RsiW
VPSTVQHTVKPWFDGKIDFAPTVTDLATSGFPLIGGRLDYIHNRAVAALVYKRHQHIINLFSWPATTTGDVKPAASQHNGYNLLTWTRDGMIGVAVSDVNPTELQQFAQALQASTTRP